MKYLRPSIVLFLLFIVGTGVIFPVCITLIANFAFPRQAQGSLVSVNGKVVGSELIGQKFTDPKDFHPRPSANDYDAENSGGTNLGPTNSQLLTGAKGFDGVKQLAIAYRKENGLGPDVVIPSDAVTRSGSGLDPDISVENALLQAPRIAKARGVSVSQVQALVQSMIQPKFVGIFGAPCVNVLELNIALDKHAVTP